MRFEVMGSFFLISKTSFYPSSSILPCCKLSEGLKQTNLQIFISNHQIFLTPEIPKLFFPTKRQKRRFLDNFQVPLHRCPSCNKPWSSVVVMPIVRKPWYSWRTTWVPCQQNRRIGSNLNWFVLHVMKNWKVIYLYNYTAIHIHKFLDVTM